MSETHTLLQLCGCLGSMVPFTGTLFVFFFFCLEVLSLGSFILYMFMYLFFFFAIFSYFTTKKKEEKESYLANGCINAWASCGMKTSDSKWRKTDTFKNFQNLSICQIKVLHMYHLEARGPKCMTLFISGSYVICSRRISGLVLPRMLHCSSKVCYKGMYGSHQ